MIESLFYRGTFDLSNFEQILRTAFLRDVVRNSLVLATTVAFVTTTIAFALAYCFAYVKDPRRAFHAVGRPTADRFAAVCHFASCDLALWGETG